MSPMAVTGGFPSKMASNTGVGVFFDVSLHKRLNKVGSPVIWDAMMIIVTSLWWDKVA